MRHVINEFLISDVCVVSDRKVKSRVQLKKPQFSQGMQGAQIQHVDSNIAPAVDGQQQMPTQQDDGGKMNTEEQLTTNKNEITLQ